MMPLGSRLAAKFSRAETANRFSSVQLQLFLLYCRTLIRFNNPKLPVEAIIRYENFSPQFTAHLTFASAFGGRGDRSK
jgi:hypothetical protein